MKAIRSLLLCTCVVAPALSPRAFAAADYSTPYAFSTLAGASSIGSQDGTGVDARFYSPQDVTTDAAGNVYIADEGNHTIRKITPAGVVTTLAGSAGLPGSADGTGADARFDSPQGIVADATGNLFVTDTGNHTIRKVTPAGVVTTVAGLAGVTGSTDATGSAARFNRPRKLAIDATGNLFVTEAGNNTVRKITPAGVVTTVANDLRFPESDDIYAALPVSYGAIAVDANGALYVATFAFSNIQTHAPNWGDNYQQYVGFVVKIAPDGVRTSLWETSSYSYFDGRRQHGDVTALKVDANGQLIVGSANKISRYVAATTTFTDLAGDGSLGSADGPAATAKFGFPFAFAFDRTGTLYIADTGNNKVRKFTAPGTVASVAGIALDNATTTLDGTGAAARFSEPAATVVDANGNLYVADAAARCIRKITPAGVVTTLAGAPDQGGSTDGTGTAARFGEPTGLTLSPAGVLFVADRSNHVIRRVTLTGDVSTFAGTAGNYGYADGQGAAAQFWYPSGVAADAAGNLYVTDTSNEVIRKIAADGTVTTVAGTALQIGYADGTGGAARFTVPYGIAASAGGTLFVTEPPDGPTIARVRMITPGGVVSTLAGADHGSTDGSGTSARFHNPTGIAVDPANNVFIADTANQTIRKITPVGAVSTLAGLADSPGSTDGAGRDARFYFPRGIAVDAQGSLYVTSGTTVRKGLLATVPVISTQPASQSVASGASASFSVAANAIPTPTYQWFLNGTALSGATSASLSLANVSATNAGDYTVVVSNPVGSVTSSKATLTVTAAPSPPPPPPSGGGGGGGAPSTWFLGALASLAALRAWRQRHADRVA